LRRACPRHQWSEAIILDDVVESAIKPFGLERFLTARAAE
jgi:hypothetical protein